VHDVRAQLNEAQRTQEALSHDLEKAGAAKHEVLTLLALLGTKVQILTAAELCARRATQQPELQPSSTLRRCDRRNACQQLVSAASIAGQPQLQPSSTLRRCDSS
jgi:hypothetical protein